MSKNIDATTDLDSLVETSHQTYKLDVHDLLNVFQASQEKVVKHTLP